MARRFVPRSRLPWRRRRARRSTRSGGVWASGFQHGASVNQACSGVGHPQANAIAEPPQIPHDTAWVLATIDSNRVPRPPHTAPSERGAGRTSRCRRHTPSRAAGPPPRKRRFRGRNAAFRRRGNIPAPGCCLGRMPIALCPKSRSPRSPCGKCRSRHATEARSLDSLRCPPCRSS